LQRGDVRRNRLVQARINGKKGIVRKMGEKNLYEDHQKKGGERQRSALAHDLGGRELCGR